MGKKSGGVSRGKRIYGFRDDQELSSISKEVLGKFENTWSSKKRDPPRGRPVTQVSPRKKNECGGGSPPTKKGISREINRRSDAR